jgi:quinol monooxygenase YgiN
LAPILAGFLRLTAPVARRHALPDHRSREETMPVRLVISFTAEPGKGAELAQAMKERCITSAKDDGCGQFEVFQSALNPERFCLLELWEDSAALAAHAKLQAARPPVPAGLRQGGGEREDYTYNRTR